MALDRHNFNQIMESWARWVHQGELVSGYGSLMAKLIAQKGVMNFGSSGQKSPVLDCVEAQVEAALMALSRSNRKSAEVVRVHYGAVTLKGVSAHALNRDKAHALDMSLKTYEAHLTRARKHIINTLGGKRA